ncbi:TetR family transcriptional regulator [Microbacterium ulmi]|uniref:TetR/AcrR family transcriptional regulator n=1 Tax=Microbacterium ulmi TaxID=179095 RepID=A0A7Y2M2A9_9MICO|nr:AcrR family transcriptional regulator [Microbacterium ulmi]NNH03783.1 TetR/AcrR family transcriptional regulator [Microbacterium ulmi]
MASITRRPATAKRRASAEAEILAATHRLLTAGSSFTELGVQRIADEAGVARSTFYMHFPDKSALLVRLASTTLTTSFGITSAWRPADGLEALEAVFTQVVAYYREQSAVLLAIHEVATYDTTVREFWRGQLALFTDSTIAVLREEQAVGDADAAVDADLAGRLVVVGGERAILDHIGLQDERRDAAFVRELASTWWYGVYRRPSDARAAAPE